MNAKIASALAESLKDNGLTADIDNNYSGWCMYGTTTSAVITDSDLVTVGVHLHKVCLDLDEKVPSLRTRTGWSDTRFGTT